MKYNRFEEFCVIEKLVVHRNTIDEESQETELNKRIIETNELPKKSNCNRKKKKETREMTRKIKLQHLQEMQEKREAYLYNFQNIVERNLL